jgi:hypothetical protein
MTFLNEKDIKINKKENRFYWSVFSYSLFLVIIELLMLFQDIKNLELAYLFGFLILNFILLICLIVLKNYTTVYRDTTLIISIIFSKILILLSFTLIFAYASSYPTLANVFQRIPKDVLGILITLVFITSLAFLIKGDYPKRTYPKKFEIKMALSIIYILICLSFILLAMSFIVSLSISILGLDFYSLYARIIHLIIIMFIAYFFIRFTNRIYWPSKRIYEILGAGLIFIVMVLISSNVENNFINSILFYSLFVTFFIVDYILIREGFIQRIRFKKNILRLELGKATGNITELILPETVRNSKNLNLLGLEISMTEKDGLGLVSKGRNIILYGQKSPKLLETELIDNLARDIPLTRAVNVYGLLIKKWDIGSKEYVEFLIPILVNKINKKKKKS